MMDASVTAIIPHYWESRMEDLPRIIEALNAGDVRPTDIIIWNNMERPVDVPGAMVVNAGRNWGIAARFAAAYLARTKYVFFQDNDLLVQPGTLRNMLSFAPDIGVSIELQGRILNDGPHPYSQSEYVTGVTRIVDVGLSRTSLMLRATAVSLCARIPPDVIDDDIWTSRCCTIQVIAHGPEEGWIDIPEREGLSLNAGEHIARRDVLAREWKT
jgi:hypothetical protein